jgi:hypothetical protein
MVVSVPMVAQASHQTSLEVPSLAGVVAVVVQKTMPQALAVLVAAEMVVVILNQAHTLPLLLELPTLVVVAVVDMVLPQAVVLVL